MKPESWKRIEKVYHAALERTPEERAAFLDEACTGDEELRREVAALLDYDDSDASFIEVPALEVAARALAAHSPVEPETNLAAEGNQAESSTSDSLTIDSLQPGQVICSFRILSKIGQGGMGEVYLAEDTRLGRKVALKVLAPDLVANSQARARFLREARLASNLDHPNICTIHEVGESEGRYFIAMQYVEGRTLKKVIDGRPLSLDGLLSISLQVADALALAHSQGVIHRDIKSNNVIITERGQAKILDFGLAKLLEKEEGGAEPDLTQTGMPLGTPSYMSPEQARGERADHRSDIFSFGVVLYEMATGRTPFRGRSQAETMNAVINQPHRHVAELNNEIPPELSKIIDRVLPKEPGDRYQSIEDAAADLRQVAQSVGISISSPSAGVMAPPVRPRRGSPLGSFWAGAESRMASARWALIAMAILLVVAAAVWLYRRNANLEWAKGSIAEIEELARAGEYSEAYVLALKAKQYLPNDAALARLMPMISDDLSVASEPAGARVYLKRFTYAERSQPPARELVGTTPIGNLKIARGDYIIYIEKDGYAPIQRSVSSALDRMNKAILGPYELRREVKAIEGKSGEASFLFDADAPIKVEASLIPATESPDRMAFVPGGKYRLVSSGRPTEASVQLDDYFIDQFEVSNREFIEFINAGGYLKKQFWKYPFIKDGKELSWEVAMRLFKDRTGLAGPRGWSNQNYPDGKGDHPVTDITWYEAAAYAAFRDKQLPTVFQWEKAARDGITNEITGFTMPWGLANPKEPFSYRANMMGSGTTSVSALEFGMSPYGCYQMTGNVAEWLLNAQAEGYTTAGGSWKDPPYIFGAFGAVPAFTSVNTLGFRCVLNSPNAAGDQGAMRLNLDEAVAVHKPTSEAQFQAMLRHYQYDQTPLDPEVVEVKETDAWRREKISFVGDGGERTFAYLYLPKNARQPFQVIHYYPGAGVDFALTLPDEVEGHAGPYIKAGRAVFAVVLKGYTERPRPPNYTPPDLNSVKYRELVANRVIDSRRGLDYLVTRGDIDPSKIALFGVSMSQPRLTLVGVESRYSSIILMGCGYMLPGNIRIIPEADGANFLPHIRAPKLWIHGRYDERVIFKTLAEPLYKLLGEPKRLIAHEGGHVPPLEVSVPMINNWLDETLGPVKRE